METTHTLRKSLEQIVSPAWVSAKLPDRMAYSRDQWPRFLIELRQRQLPPLPDLIVWPGSAQETAAVLAVCVERGVPVCPVGGASAVTGAASPSQGGVIIDLKRLDRIRWLNHTDGMAEIEAGFVGIHLEHFLQRAGWTLGHFPSSILCSTLGGWVATRSAGQASSRYGKIEDMVVDIEMACTDGSLVWTRNAFDLTPLIVGSEGTMGLITACRLKIHPAPQVRNYRGVLFPSLDAGLQAMQKLLQNTTPPPTVLRLYDPIDSMISSHRKAKSMGPSELLSHPHLPEPETYSKALVSTASSSSLTTVVRRTWGGWFSRIRRKLVETALKHTDRGLTWLEYVLPTQSLMILGYEEQTQSEADTRMQQALQLCLDLGAKDLGVGPGLHWFHHRYHVSFKQSQVFGLGAFSDTMEVASSWSQLRPLYHAVKSAIQKDAMVMAHFSHAYPDGCSIYFSFAGHDTSGHETARYDRIWKQGLAAAAGVQATVSHHHGVGINKAHAMFDELGASGVALLRSVQHALAASAPLNPGKLILAPPAAQVGGLHGATVPISSHSPLHSSVVSPESISSNVALPAPVLDAMSMLLTADARHSLESIESFAQIHGFSAGFRSGWDLSLREWMEQGQIFALQTYELFPLQRIYGLTVRLPHGDMVELGRAPRSSAGPALHHLFWRTHGQFGQIQRVMLRLRRVPERQVFWQVPLDLRDDAFHLLREWGHHHQHPDDGFVLMSTKDRGCVVHVQCDLLQKPRIRQWILSSAQGGELLSRPMIPVPAHPLWLELTAPWSVLASVLEELPHLLPWSIAQWALLQPTHTSGAVLCLLEPQKHVRDEASLLAAQLPNYQTALRQMTRSDGVFLWSAQSRVFSEPDNTAQTAIHRQFLQTLHRSFSTS